MTAEPEPGWHHVTQRQGLRDPINRHTLAIALIVAPVTFGTFALAALGADASTLAWVVGGIAILAALGGWLHPPDRSLRFKGALAGVAIALGALGAAYAYTLWRGNDRRDRRVRAGYNLLLPIIVGGLPGVGLYYKLVRRRQS